MVAGIECDLEATIQITKITWPLLSVTQMTKNGDISVVCKQDEASSSRKNSRWRSSTKEAVSTSRT